MLSRLNLKQSGLNPDTSRYLTDLQHVSCKKPNVCLSPVGLVLGGKCKIYIYISCLVFLNCLLYRMALCGLDAEDPFRNPIFDPDA